VVVSIWSTHRHRAPQKSAAGAALFVAERRHLAGRALDEMRLGDFPRLPPSGQPRLASGRSEGNVVVHVVEAGG
jgi:hypothetical protein